MKNSYLIQNFPSLIETSIVNMSKTNNKPIRLYIDKLLDLNSFLFEDMEHDMLQDSFENYIQEKSKYELLVLELENFEYSIMESLTTILSYNKEQNYVFLSFNDISKLYNDVMENFPKIKESILKCSKNTYISYYARLYNTLRAFKMQNIIPKENIPFNITTPISLDITMYSYNNKLTDIKLKHSKITIDDFYSISFGDIETKTSTYPLTTTLKEYSYYIELYTLLNFIIGFDVLVIYIFYESIVVRMLVIFEEGSDIYKEIKFKSLNLITDGKFLNSKYNQFIKEFKSFLYNYLRFIKKNYSSSFISYVDVIIKFNKEGVYEFLYNDGEDKSSVKVKNLYELITFINNRNVLNDLL